MLLITSPRDPGHYQQSRFTITGISNLWKYNTLPLFYTQHLSRYYITLSRLELFVAILSHFLIFENIHVSVWDLKWTPVIPLCIQSTGTASLFKQVSQAIFFSFVSMDCHRLALHHHFLLSKLLVLHISVLLLAFPSHSKTVLPVFAINCVYHDLPCLCLPQKNHLQDKNDDVVIPRNIPS